MNVSLRSSPAARAAKERPATEKTASAAVGSSAIDASSKLREALPLPTAGTVVPTPVLLLDAESEPLYNEIRDRLDKGAIKHRRWAVALLMVTMVCVIAAILLIAYAGSLLGSDLQTARLNEPLIQDIEKQRQSTDVRLAAKKERTVAIKKDFDLAFGVGHLWFATEVPELKSRLTWVDLKGSHGFAVGENQFVYTTDGQTWQLPKIEQELGEAFEAAGAGAAFGVDARTLGWVVGKRGKIARTTTGVAEWKVVTVKRADGTPVNGDVYSVFFQDEMTGWAVGGGGLLARTTDGGETWMATDVPDLKADIYQVKFFKDKVGIAIGSRSTILFSSNGGQTWENQSAKITDLVSHKNVAELNLSALSLDDSRSYTDAQRIVVAGTNGIVLFSETDKAANNQSPNWKLAHLQDHGSLDGRSIAGVGTIRWVDRFATTPNMIAVGDKGTILVSRNRGETWRAETGEPRPTLLYAQSILPDRVSIAGMDGYLAQLELGDPETPARITRERTPHKDRASYQLSPRNQREQVAVGDGILRRVNLSQSLQILKNLDPERFRDVAINSASEQSYYENLPKMVEEHVKLRDIIAELKLVDKEVNAIRNEITEIEKRKDVAHKANPVTTADFMLWVNGARALVVVVAFFMIRFLVSLYRYHNNQAARFEAQANALRSMRVIPGTIGELATWFGTGTLAEEGAAGGFVSDILANLKELVGARTKA